MDLDDPDAHILLAECYAGLFSRDNRREYLLQARDHVETALRINRDIEGGRELRRKLAEISELLGIAK